MAGFGWQVNVEGNEGGSRTGSVRILAGVGNLCHPQSQRVCYSFAGFRQWQGEDYFRRLRGQGLVLVDLEAVDRSIGRGKAGNALRSLMNAYREQEAIDQSLMERYQRSLTGWLLRVGTIRRRDSKAVTRPVSVVAADHAAIRRAVRVLSMVHELHKAGYQRIRIAPGMSPSGMDWRCQITAANNIDPDGWTPRSWDRDVVAYTSADKDRFFGWKDAPGKNARQLARLFLLRFPRVAKNGAGRDRPYAGWYVEMLGAAENGKLPVFYADYDLDLPAIELPPPPLGLPV